MPTTNFFVENQISTLSGAAHEINGRRAVTEEPDQTSGANSSSTREPASSPTPFKLLDPPLVFCPSPLEYSDSRT